MHSRAIVFKRIAELSVVAFLVAAGDANAETYAQVFMAHGRTCAITSVGGLQCWGENPNGQVGDGSAVDRVTPVPVPGVPGPVASAGLGSGHTCAVTFAGEVFCWGQNTRGQLGNGGTAERETWPVKVLGLDGPAVAVTAGGLHTCALLASGTVQCWGDNSSAQLGIPIAGTRFRATAGTVPSLPGVTSIAASVGGTCGVRGGQLICWPGTPKVECTTEGGGGILGAAFGPITSCSQIPQPAPQLIPAYVGVRALAGDCLLLQASVSCTLSGGVRVTDAVQVADGGDHHCVLGSGGGVKCWGLNSSGQLGDGTLTRRSSPVDVRGMSSGIVGVAADGARTCAVTREGALKCWGEVTYVTPTDFPWSSTPTSYQGLWWAAPPNTESGWGLGIAHQGETLFVTWFTFDLDGSPTWFVMSNAVKTSKGNYHGALHRMTGPAFGSSVWDASRVVATEVGSATLRFPNAESGVFTYSVNGITQSKAIARYAFASSRPSCDTQPGMPNAQPNFEGLWWRPSEPGWGAYVAHQGNRLIALIFTYGADGKPQWLMLGDGWKPVNRAEYSFHGNVDRAVRGPAFTSQPWDASKVSLRRVGDLSFSFDDNTTGGISYHIDGRVGFGNLERMVFATPIWICH